MKDNVLLRVGVSVLTRNHKGSLGIMMALSRIHITSAASDYTPNKSRWVITRIGESIYPVVGASNGEDPAPTLRHIGAHVSKCLRVRAWEDSQGWLIVEGLGFLLNWPEKFCYNPLPWKVLLYGSELPEGNIVFIPDARWFACRQVSDTGSVGDHALTLLWIYIHAYYHIYAEKACPFLVG